MYRRSHLTMALVALMTSAVLCSPLTGKAEGMALPPHSDNSKDVRHSFYDQQRRKQQQSDEENNTSEDFSNLDHLLVQDTDSIRLGAIR